MTDYTDLIARLRGPVPHTKGFSEIFVDADRNKAERGEAADALKALQAENERLRALLSDLADAFENEAGRGSELPEGYAFAPYVNARAALTGSPR